jgi:hypothetical protein
LSSLTLAVTARVGEGEMRDRRWARKAMMGSQLDGYGRP